MLLDELLPHEMSLRRQKKLPAAAAPPQLKTRVTKELGTVDADALRIESRSLFSVERLLERALVERERRDAAGISDSVEAAQPPEAPAFDSAIVGKRLEVCWPFKLGKTVKIWASGTVRRVADGLTDTRSKRAQKFYRRACCCGRGTPIRIAGRLRERRGLCCCPRSGTASCSMHGSSTHASL